jgi:hypothetical protein
MQKQVTSPLKNTVIKMGRRIGIIMVIIYRIIYVRTTMYILYMIIYNRIFNTFSKKHIKNMQMYSCIYKNIT